MLGGAMRFSDKVSGFSVVFFDLNEVPFTMTRIDRTVCHHEPRHLNMIEFISGSTFPNDYNFNKVNASYLMGMSVPPVMTAQIATNIFEQWLNKLK